MSGRAAGYCAGYPVPGFMNPIYGRGFGYGWGRGWGGGIGRGFGRGFRGGRGWGGYWGAPYGGYAYPSAPVYGAPPVPGAYPYAYGAGPSPEQEADMLKGQAEYFEDALEGIKKRIAELEAAQE